MPCSGCILVIDDDPDIREALSFHMEAMGCTVVAARDGVDALQCLEHCPPPCLVLLDLNMPRMDGETFARAVRAHCDYCKLHIVSMSAGTRRLCPPEVEAHFNKPFDLEVLEPSIGRLCRDGVAAPG